MATYVNRYDDLRTQELPPPRADQLGQHDECADARRRVHASGCRWLPRWQVHASHAYHWKELTFDPGSTDPTRGASEANDPRNIFKLRSYINADDRIEFDAFFRYVGALPQPAVDAYTELDARLDVACGPDGICR